MTHLDGTHHGTPDAAPLDADAPGAQRKGNVLQLAGAVFWAFFGVRKSSALAADAKNLKPVHVIIAGVVGALIFVAALVLIVNWVIRSGIAT